MIKKNLHSFALFLLMLALAQPAFCSDTNTSGKDSDGDGLLDAYELENGLDPNNPDTDGNDSGDGFELVPGSSITHLQAQDEWLKGGTEAGSRNAPAEDAVAVTSPVIFNVSETVKPGEVIGVQGHLFGSNPVLLYARVNGTETTVSASQPMSILTKSNTYVGALIPAGEPMGLYAVQIQNGTLKSPVVYVNRSRCWGYEIFDEVEPGRKFRLWGRNLSFGGATPQVRFVDPATGASTDAAVTTTGSDEFMLYVTAPSTLKAGVQYRVFVNNGLGGKWGETEAEKRITARTTGGDPFALNVPWASDYFYASNVYNVKTDSRLSLKAKGDGATDDRAAIQAAIDKANADGGGVVYLPASTYLIRKQSSSTTCLSMKSRVVLKGDGQSSTILKNGNSLTAGDITFFNLGSNAVDLVGFLNFRVDDGSPSAGPGAAKFVGVNAYGAKRMFFKNVWLESELSIRYCDRFLLADSYLRHRDIFYDSAASRKYSQGYMLYRNSRVTFRNSHFYYWDGRLHLSWGNGGGNKWLIENCRFTRDPDKTVRDRNEYGGLEISAISDITILNNTFDQVGTTPMPDSNDTETILTQEYGGNKTWGTATGGTSTTLTDSTKTFAAYGYPFAVALMDGSGAGQWRWVTSSSGNNLTVDRPWDVPPASGTKYALATFWNQNTLVYGNTLSCIDARAIWSYDSSLDNWVVVKNRIVNGDGIDFRVFDRRGDFHGIHFLFNIYVADNVAERLDQRTPYYPTHIGAHLTQQSGDLFGTFVFKPEFRRNTLRGHPAYTTAALTSGQWYSKTGLKGEGYWGLVATNKSGSSYQDAPCTDNTRMGVVGAIFDSNSAINTRDAYHLCTGVYGTVIYKPNNSNVTNMLLDQTGAGATHASVGTYVGSAGSAPPPPPPGDPVVTIAATDANASEANFDTGTFTLSRSGDVTATLTVNLSISGSAGNGADYNSIANSITIPGGASSATIVIRPIDDTAVESSESAVVSLVSGTGYTVGTPNSATVTISDNDAVPGGSGTGLMAEYFDNMDFTNAKLSRTDAKVDFNWGRNAPDASLGTDSFSVRWTGQVLPKYSQTYTFYTTSDDGVRLWVNGQQVINNWTDHGAIENSGTISLAAGQKYSIKMEFYDNGWDAIARLSWSSASQPKEVIPQSQLFPATTVALPVVSIVAIDANASEANLNPGAFAVSRTGDTGSALTVKLSITGSATNGVDYNTIQNSITIPAGAASAAITVTPMNDTTTETDETVVVSLAADTAYAYGTANSAAITIADDDVAGGTGTGLTGEYFDNMDFTNLKFTRTDTKIDFNWGRNAPDVSMGTDSFSVRWTGQVLPKYSQTYTFYTTSDDGVRLWVNGQQVVSNWTDHGAIENSGTISLAAGQKYSIKMEFYDNGWDAIARLSWSSASQPKEVIPQSQLFPAATTPTPTGLPAPWKNQDVGAVGVAGSASYSNGTFTLKGSGSDIWGASDEFQYVYQPISGDGEIIARVSSVQATHPWAKAGVMIRESLSSNSRFAMMIVSGSSGLAFQRRVATGGSCTNSSGAAAAAPIWVRMVRQGSTLTGYSSNDGISWTKVGAESIGMGATIYMGLALTAHDDKVLSTAAITNVKVNGVASVEVAPAVSNPDF